jgi:tRNA/tmRNA/rRNA uracil-C5-methylase (TrmA/RlmC/RlmD family)
MKQSTINENFYTSLAKGEIKKTLGGLQTRFSYENVVNNPSVKKYFLPFLEKEIKKSDVVLDYGCGAGVLLPIISKFCKEVHGFDVILPFVDLSKNLIIDTNIKNATVYNDTEFNELFLGGGGGGGGVWCGGFWWCFATKGKPTKNNC